MFAAAKRGSAKAPVARYSRGRRSTGGSPPDRPPGPIGAQRQHTQRCARTRPKLASSAGAANVHGQCGNRQRWQAISFKKQQISLVKAFNSQVTNRTFLAIASTKSSQSICLSPSLLCWVDTRSYDSQLFMHLPHRNVSSAMAGLRLRPKLRRRQL